MEKLAVTEYQDVYRITNGALLVINKFKEQPGALKRLSYTGWGELSKRHKKNIKKLHPGCQDVLRIVESGFTDKPTGLSFKKGSVFYNEIPVCIVSESEWDYQIKTTNKDFSGTFDEMEKMLSDILFLIRTKNMR